MKKNKKIKRKGQGGFTFIEILVAMMILFILISIAGFAYFKYIGKAKIIATKNQIQILSLALDSYYLDCNQYPTTEQGLEALWEKPILEPVPKGWNGPYIKKKIERDSWGNKYEYIAPGPNGLPFGIRSFGADGMEGGEGNNADIKSWE